MDWHELAALAADPLVTIGAHTVNHPILTKLDDKAVRTELGNSRTVIEAALGVRPAASGLSGRRPHRRRPARVPDRRRARLQDRGDDAAGRGVPQHAEHLTALPRISLNGNFQQPRYAKVLISGAATGLWNGFRPVNVDLTRCLSTSSCISGIAGSTQPMPATT